MFNSMFASAALLLLFLAPADTPEPREPDWQIAVQRAQSVVIHVPRVTVTRATIVSRPLPAPLPPRPPLAMVEKKADDCVKMESIRGFSVSRTNSVDLMMRDGKQLRLKLNKDCPALGFYSGFYVKSHPDKKMCAGRDAIRSRSGRLCNVQEIRKLVPVE